MKTIRIWLCVVTLSVLAACGGGGGDAAPAEPARAGSADIGVSGGTVDAVLEGGTVVKLDVPAGALAATTTFRIDPVSAPTGTLGGFHITPAEVPLRAPVTLTVTLPPGTNVDPDTTLAFDTSSGQLPVSTSLDPATRTLTVRLTSLPAASTLATGTSSTGRAHALASGPPPFVAMAIASADYPTRLRILEVVVINVVANGSDANARIVQFVIDAVLQDSRGFAEPSVHVAARMWAGVVCAQQQFNVSALDTFAGVDIQTFEQRAKDVFVSDRNALALNATVARLTPVETGCAGVPADFAEPVRARLPIFLADVSRALDLLDPTIAADFDQLFRTRFRELLDLAADFGAFGLLDLQNTVIASVTAQLERVRAVAYASCRSSRNQKLQAQLISALIVDARTNSLVPEGWDQRLLSDVQFCGMPLHWTVVDARGTVLQQVDAGGIGPGLTTTAATLQVSGAAKVVLSGPLAALVCPVSSQNNEQLVFAAGPSTGPASSVRQLTPSNANGYLEASSLEFDVPTLLSQGAEKLVIARQGGFCSGDFSILSVHATIATLALDAGAVQITTSSLPDAVAGTAYATTLAANGGTPPLVWSATGLPAGLGLNAATGEITGTPTSAGTSSVAIRVSGSDGSVAQATIALRITVGGRFPAGSWFNNDVKFFQDGVPINFLIAIRIDIKGDKITVFSTDLNGNAPGGPAFVVTIANGAATSFHAVGKQGGDDITLDGTLLANGHVSMQWLQVLPGDPRARITAAFDMAPIR